MKPGRRETERTSVSEADRGFSSSRGTEARYFMSCTIARSYGLENCVNHTLFFAKGRFPSTKVARRRRPLARGDEQHHHAAGLVKGHREAEGAGAGQGQKRPGADGKLGPCRRIPGPSGGSACGAIASRAVRLDQHDGGPALVISGRPRSDRRLVVPLPARAVPRPGGLAADVDQLAVGSVVDQIRFGASLAGGD